jgi:putative PIN family toxin of toxin-antitoxin system
VIPRQAAQQENASGAVAPKVVLDTNTVLDWLVFGDPGCVELSRRILQRQVVWHATMAMRNELAHVLPRAAFARWQPDIDRVLTCFGQHARLVDNAEGAVPAQVPTCKDPDDQKFIDLACMIGARWLFTRDRALLDLARSARQQGVEVLKPAEWIFDSTEKAAAPGT